MSTNLRKYLALIAIVIALAISAFGVARAATGITLRSLASLDDRSSGTAEPTEALEPTQAPEMTETAEPAQFFGDPELQDVSGQDSPEGCDGHGRDSSGMDDNSSGSGSDDGSGH